MFRLTWGLPVVLIAVGLFAVAAGTPAYFSYGLIVLAVVLEVVWYYAVYRRTGNRDFL